MMFSRLETSVPQVPLPAKSRASVVHVLDDAGGVEGDDPDEGS
jgi:hypothetical protein